MFSSGATPGRPLTRRGSVLLVDDEPNVLAGLSLALRREPYHVLTATSGAQALSLLEQNDVLVLVSDEQMPNMSGSDLLRRVRELYPFVVRMVLTGNATLDTTLRAINEGEVFRFLVKPCDPIEFVHQVRSAIQAQSASSKSSHLAQVARRQRAVLRELEREHPGISQVDVDANGAILIDDGHAESLPRNTEEDLG